MSQHDYNLANQTGANFRSDLNNALLAIVSQNSGATEPSTMFAYQWWADTTSGFLKLRNAANSAWITVGSLSLTNLGLASLAGATFTGALLAAVGSVSLPGLSFSGDPDSGAYWVSANTWELVSGGVAYARISSAGITFLGTGATTFASGTTAQRPGSPVNGMIRYNTTIPAMEAYVNGGWAIVPGVTAYPFATADIANGAITPAKKAALGQQESSANSSQTFTSTTFADITSLSVSITTTGRPVFMAMLGTASGNSSVQCSDTSSSSQARIKFLRDSTDISIMTIFLNPGAATGTLTINVPPSSFMYIDTPAAGTYTYKAQCAAGASGDTVTVTNVKLMVFEL